MKADVEADLILMCYKVWKATPGHLPVLKYRQLHFAYITSSCSFV